MPVANATAVLLIEYRISIPLKNPLPRTGTALLRAYYERVYRTIRLFVVAAQEPRGVFQRNRISRVDPDVPTDYMTLSDKPIAWNGGGAGPDESAPLPRPVHMDALAEECLQALAGSGLAHLISVGGALGLMHYLDYRGTHDADAWWAESVSTLEREQVIAVIVRTLARHGDVRTRAWGDVVSIELSTLTRVSFSFQIARRSARLAACRRAAWAEVWVDSLEDVVAAKMAALVERGAPRDFRDIFAICQAGIILPADCWCLWARRQTQSGVAPDRSRANLAIQTHLERIALHRPLDSISDPKERETAARVRHWFNEEFSCAGQ